MTHLIRSVLVAEVMLMSAPLSAADPIERERCLAVLRAGLASDEFWPAMHAAEALTLAGHGSEVLPALKRRTAIDDQQQCGLAREAVRAGDRSKVGVLFTILDKPGSNGHTHAAESLFKVAELGDGTKMRAALAQDADPRLKLMAAAALARSGDRTALAPVRAHVTHADVELRKVAVWVLGQTGSPADISILQAQWSSETEPLARAYFAHALAMLGDPVGRKALGENLSSPVPAVRTYAAEFAGHCQAAEYHDRLVKLLDDDTLDVRVRAAQSLLTLTRKK